MCGILAILDLPGVGQDALKVLTNSIDQRGPDYLSPLILHLTKCGPELHLKASVLHLSGDIMQKQPVIDKDNNVLMFNGLIYQFADQVLPIDVSDTTFLAAKFASCKTKEEVVENISFIDGPFALILWHQGLQTLFYCRDLFGRKSLCLLRDVESNDLLAISSVACAINHDSKSWSEVDCKSIHLIKFDGDEDPIKYRYLWNMDKIFPKTIRCVDNNILQDEQTLGSIVVRHLSPLNMILSRTLEFSPETYDDAVKQLGGKLMQAISKRYVLNRRCCLNCRRQNSDKNEVISCHHTKVAVAFSGGIDSTLIALALDDIVDKHETIDLITVAFKNQSPDRKSVGSAFNELARIRKTRNWRLILCDISLDELRSKRDDTIKNLIYPCNTVIDDSLGCACWFIGRAKGRSIESQMMNQSLSSKFETFLKYNFHQDAELLSLGINYNYTSPASMLFVGSSIDEQLGGYSSHRAAWANSGLPGVLEEVSFLMRRLSSRNLGRDDRSFSSHGRDLKIPYLDFDFVSYLNQLPIEIKMNLAEPLNVGPKKILRELARSWGLKETGDRVKRAMQFGTRIANLEDKTEKGNDICSRLNS